MFGNMFKMDWKRCFHIPRMMMIIVAMNVLIILFSWEDIQWLLRYPDSYDIIRLLSLFMSGDGFKFVVFMLFAFLYTASFCSDDESKYLRMILTRVDITTYTQSRFLSNALIIILTSMISILVFTLIMLPIGPLFQYKDSSASDSYYYRSIVEFSPLLYIMMIGLQLGVLVSACSSVGLLFSVYQSNRFVTLGIVGLSLFLGTSYMPTGTPFSFSALIGMKANYLFHYLGIPPAISYMWGILYPTLIVVLCGYLFYRRMKWRVDNGYI